jgi:23S rRNA G2445 N2-methylase RlmL
MEKTPPKLAPLRIAATCVLGLEELLAAELKTLGAQSLALERGAVACSGDWPLVAHANLWLRTANRVLVEIGRCAAGDDQLLYAGLRNLVRRKGARPDGIDVGRLLSPTRTVAIEASSSASQLRDTRWIAQRAKDGVVDGQRDRHGLRSDIDRDAPDLPMRLRLHRDEATLFLDTSGGPLDRRGYREQTVMAPAREQLAAAMVLAAEWSGRGPIVDPMCGSGTLLIEAASWALGLSPQALRPEFAFERLPFFKPGEIAGWRAECGPAVADQEGLKLYGVDRDRQAVAAAGANLVKAGFDDIAFLKAGDAFEWPPPPAEDGGLVLINPPYGERLAQDADGDPWKRLGDLLKQRYQGYTAVILAGGEGLGKTLGLKPRRRYPVMNGPIEAKILVVDLY